MYSSEPAYSLHAIIFVAVGEQPLTSSQYSLTDKNTTSLFFFSIRTNDIDQRKTLYNLIQGLFPFDGSIFIGSFWYKFSPKVVVMSPFPRYVQLI